MILRRLARTYQPWCAPNCRHSPQAFSPRGAPQGQRVLCRPRCPKRWMVLRAKSKPLQPLLPITGRRDGWCCEACWRAYPTPHFESSGQHFSGQDVTAPYAVPAIRPRKPLHPLQKRLPLSGAFLVMNDLVSSRTLESGGNGYLHGCSEIWNHCTRAQKPDSDWIHCRRG